MNNEFKPSNKDKIIYILKPTPHRNVPYIPYNGMAIRFYEIVDIVNERMELLIIDYAYLYNHALTLQELYSLADQNTQRYFEHTFKSLKQHVIDNLDTHTKNDAMRDLLDRLILSRVGIHPEKSIYVLSNQNVNSGSTCILYPNVLLSISRQLNDNLLLMPLSIHETVVIPSHLCSSEQLEKIQQLSTQLFSSRFYKKDILTCDLLLYSSLDNIVSIAE